jgi:hypothetical protein
MLKFGFATVILLFAFSATAKGTDGNLRELIDSSTSYDEGFATIRVSSQGRAEVRAQMPDKASVSIEEIRAGKSIHTVTFPAGELPQELTELSSLFSGIYKQAKKNSFRI